MTSSARASNGRRNFQTKRFRSLQVDDQLELGRLQDRQVAGALTLENAANVPTGLAVCIIRACSVADETTDLWEFARKVHGRNGLTQRHFCKTFVLAGSKRIAQDHECINVLAPNRRESSFEFGLGTGVRRVNLDAERSRSCAHAGQVGLGAGISEG